MNYYDEWFATASIASANHFVELGYYPGTISARTWKLRGRRRTSVNIVPNTHGGVIDDQLQSK